ncbi:hypothetical protein R9C00_11140 [Flammeovirgaceae bacterium SG7u.111]|nr:hypothetical protein [Flammeovirgaceae bacterium SG7u.132]WPO38006.1 hypothetical protein R9C00_11140 [Flammeovirgaceae bacterium SG7u.111]
MLSSLKKIESNRFAPLAISLVSGLLLGILQQTPFVFVGLIGFLWLEELLDAKLGKNASFWLWGYTALGFACWNAFTTFWMLSEVGGLAPVFWLGNALLMAIPLVLFQVTKKEVAKLGYFTLLCYWLTFEYLHSQWAIAWPWLNLSNSLASSPLFSDWFSITGALGGSAWLLLLAVAFYRILFKKKPVFGLLVLEIFPFAIGLFVTSPSSPQEMEGQLMKGGEVLMINSNRVPLRFPGVREVSYPFLYLKNTPESLAEGRTAEVDSLQVVLLSGYEPLFTETAASHLSGQQGFFVVKNSPNTLSQSLGYLKLLSLMTQRPLISFTPQQTFLVNTDGSVDKFYEGESFLFDTNSSTTFFTKNGEYLGRVAVFFALLIFLSSWVKDKIKKR